jgi:signal transduction histidine kinase
MADCGCISEHYLKQSPVCHWVIDPDLRFVVVHGRAELVFGTEASALRGCPLAGVLSPESARAWSGRTRRCFAGETLLLRERHGMDSWYLALFPLADPADPAGAVTHAAGFALDASPWTSADHELRHTVLGALRTQDHERSTMSRFLHDTVGQNLSAAGLHLDLIRMDLEENSPDICARIAGIQRMLEGMMQELRDYSYELNPALVERAGIHSALDRLVGRYRQRFPGTVRLILDPSTKIAEPIASALYKIAQEALENAVQHSGCSLIEIAVKSTRGGPHLEIRDNGRGFDPADVLQGRRGLGLLTMEHFAAEAGFDVSIVSTRESGTVVRASAPGSAQ